MSTGKASVKTLAIKPISEVAVEALNYVADRKSGKEKSLKVSSSKVNNALMNGFDWGRIITIGGLSGVGKSTLLRQWVKDMIEINSKEEFDVLTFQFEMLGIDDVARDLSSKMNMSIKQLYSADGTLTDNDLTKLEGHLEDISKYPIHIVDNIGSVEEIKDTIIYYVSSNELIKRKRGLIVTIDHSLLVKDKDGESEKQTLDSLMRTLVLLKKYFASIGLRTMFFVLSQLNRDIESYERVTNPRLHYPTKNDLFGASSVYWSSDYVMILHMPAIIEGLGNWYGPPRKDFPSGLPVFNPRTPKQPMIYLHLIKERFGSRLIIPMLDELANGRIIEHSF